MANLKEGRQGKQVSRTERAGTRGAKSALSSSSGRASSVEALTLFGQQGTCTFGMDGILSSAHGYWSALIVTRETR